MAKQGPISLTNVLGEQYLAMINFSTSLTALVVTDYRFDTVRDLEL